MTNLAAPPSSSAAHRQNIVALGRQYIAEAEASGDARLAYREYIQLADDLRAASPAERTSLAADYLDVAESSWTRWDDALVALVELRLSEEGLPIPEWVRERRGDARSSWEPRRSSRPSIHEVDPALVAEPFLRRGILIEQRELASV